jgi:hypothetical protein
MFYIGLRVFTYRFVYNLQLTCPRIKDKGVYFWITKTAKTFPDHFEKYPHAQRRGFQFLGMKALRGACDPVSGPRLFLHRD